MSSHHEHQKGLLITAIGGLTLTVDIPLIRLADGSPWTIMMLRTGTTLVAALVTWAVWRALRSDAPKLIPGWSGLAVALCYGLTGVTFVTAVYHTSTADLVFILAFNTVFAALLSWLFLREKPRLGTMIAMLAMILGVLIIVGGSIGTGYLFGDFMALCSAFFVALAITISRASGKDMGFTALIGVVLPLAVALFMVSGEGFHVNQPWWIIFNGAVIMPISFFCLANGPKYISGPEVAMFYVLETVLAPVWVWLIFAETPSRDSLIGGAILIVTLVAHSLWQLREGRKRRAALALAHPA
ncbi:MULTISPECIES: DMT family transporter [unclassified Mesorhizobium]|uniref:DMT family transporter n=1 Tax=unclassified Mesorhizobium TaxID=325217 RepID=UPI000FCB1B0B|nr:MULTISPECIES: DMT family transporter [unclassified Mesorhizobium]TIT75015.1 MAG: DMT family transporter [Mesorhizobium sp.]TGP26999.1 DMT family transporter [Mesorhizobium sp. M1D.F.Ca.ET.231.01.1.1]TGP38957.1 DMT family transporter [Mesorhizobium sp. M1D.F.Ca.ET.234.01.1.1]TGS51164.1 DMT family transporter [Mesorhizobium sp. M1D.F.Ca.ET.184.01.1.1]TGS67049.1 DMT family transporter [Mesorhizobium sp. M1D.F.Ca.ET.183.01.1.1]